MRPQGKLERRKSSPRKKLIGFGEILMKDSQKREDTVAPKIALYDTKTIIFLPGLGKRQNYPQVGVMVSFWPSKKHFE